MHASFAALDSAQDRAACWQDAAWRALNITLSATIGAVLNGSDGMAIGFAVGLLLILAPDALNYLSRQLPRLNTRASRMKSATWHALPSSLRARLEERRRP